MIALVRHLIAFPFILAACGFLWLASVIGGAGTDEIIVEAFRESIKE